MRPLSRAEDISENWDGYLPSAAAADINRDRESIYGNPTPNYEWLAKFMELVLECDVTAEQAAMVMIGLKIMREVEAGYPVDYKDNLEDICGFVNVLYKVKEAHRESE
jgi:hypothetical protein